jgi:hypothetical protein
MRLSHQFFIPPSTPVPAVTTSQLPDAVLIGLGDRDPPTVNLCLPNPNGLGNLLT